MFNLIKKWILAGFIASVVMAVIMGYVAPLLGLPQAGVVRKISFIALDLKIATVLYFFIKRAILLPLIYVLIIRGNLRGPEWLKGVIFGIGVWLFTRVVIVSLGGGNMFNFNNPEQMGFIVVGLVGNSVYGVIVSKLTK